MSHRSTVIRAALGGVVVGGALGFGLGLLIAPDEGREVRHRLAYLLERFANQLGGIVSAFGSEDVASSARETADAVIADAREQAQQILTEAEELMSEARKRRSGRPPIHRAS